jgi:hypothetical protein
MSRPHEHWQLFTLEYSILEALARPDADTKTPDREPLRDDERLDLRVSGVEEMRSQHRPTGGVQVPALRVAGDSARRLCA